MNKVRLEDVSERGSSNLAQKDIEGIDGNYPIYGASGYIGNVDFYHQEDEYIAVVKDGAGVGRTMFLPAKSSVIGTLQYIIPKGSIFPKYLYYAVKKLNLARYNTGTTIPHIYYKDYKKETFCLPDEFEQRKVVVILETVEKVIEEQQQELLELDNLIKSRFVEMFGDMLLNTMGWDESSLESIAEIVSGITKGRKVKNINLREVPYMAVSNVKDGYIDWTTIKTIMATEQEIEQYRLMPNDILMTEGGDPDKLGRGAIIKEPMENSIHQNHIFRVRLNGEIILPMFFEEYLQHQKAKRYFLRCAKQTTGIASINMKQLRALPVLIPPLKLQNQFADFVTQTTKLKFEIQKSLDETQTLMDALMQEYFG